MKISSLSNISFNQYLPNSFGFLGNYKITLSDTARKILKNTGVATVVVVAHTAFFWLSVYSIAKTVSFLNKKKIIDKKNCSKLFCALNTLSLIGFTIGLHKLLRPYISPQVYALLSATTIALNILAIYKIADQNN